MVADRMEVLPILMNKPSNCEQISEGILFLMHKVMPQTDDADHKEATDCRQNVRSRVA